MNQYQDGSPKVGETTKQDERVVDQVVPLTFKEFLVAMVHDDEAADLLADEIGLRRE